MIFAHKFKNFELELEWKVAKGSNSGILYLAQEVTSKDKDGNDVLEPIYISAPEYQILDKRIVKGVKLSKDDQDVISRKIAERVGQMKPYVSSDCVEVIFQNIADESKIIEELYVVEVVVKSWTNDIIFSTSKGEVYIKTEGGKKKLDAYGIQEELRGRLNGF